MLLAGQVAIVTGAGRGIGRVIALVLAREGARVAVTGRTKETRDQVTAEILAEGGEARSFALDVSKDEEVDAAVQGILSTWGQIDLLVNSAAMYLADTPVWATPPSQWDEMMGINLRGVFLCSHAVIPHMMERRKGVIVNIGSRSGRRPNVNSGPYNTTKWGVIGYTASLGPSVRPYGIRVNCINPGAIITEELRADHPQGGTQEGSTQKEIAELVVYLAAKGPPDMTGQSIDVFGT